MQYVLMILKYLPMVLQAVQAVELAFGDATGQQKKEMVLGTLKHGVEALAPGKVSAAEWSALSQIVDSAVATANAVGVFRKRLA